MSNEGFPSMTALLGLLAVAGFQNRDKIAEMLGGLGQAGGGGGGLPGGLGGLLGGLMGSGGAAATAGAATAGAGGLLGGGLGELMDRFTQNGHGEAASSWVNHGPNRAIEPPQLQQAIGADVMEALEQRTGLSRQELLARLSRTLPDAVDKYTPDGRLPALS